MAKKPRSKAWLNNLMSYLAKERIDVFSRHDLSMIVNEQREDLGIPRSMTIAGLVSILLQETEVNEMELSREGSRSKSGSMKRYVLKSTSPFSIGLNLKRNSYLSHSTALFLHALTDQVPKTIYVNKEQSPKPSTKGNLSQFAIDRAFRSSPRQSTYVFVSQDYRYVLLSGKNTGRLEVTDVTGPNGEIVDTTKLERTLIDIVVRPAYSGGVFEILQAYINARDLVSVNTLLAVLKKLDYVYPYHQAIGFLMERAGYSTRDLDKFRSLGINWNFYIDYKIDDPAFDDGWKLYFPKGF